MNNEHRLQAAPALQDKDESIYQALMTAIVEHQLPPGSKKSEKFFACPSVAPVSHWNTMNFIKS